jgi:hypothetical protein
MKNQGDLLDWGVLRMAPTTDIEELRREYRARLKVVKPESDPDGFQTLRQSYERLLALLQSSGETEAGRDLSTDTAGAQAFINALNARRVSGDLAGAIELVEQTLAAHLPGSSQLQTLEDALIGQVAFDRRLSPQIFIRLVAHFDWRDTQGRIARDDPERHAALIDRVAAEDWMLELKQAADGKDDQIAALMLAPHGSALAMLKADGLKSGGAAEVRTWFDELLTHARFVLTRFDGATLALLREAVEGPPLLGESHTGKTAAAVRPPVSAPGAVPLLSPKNNMRVTVAIAVVALAMVGGRMWWKSNSSGSGNLPDTSLAVSIAAPMLKDPTKPWLATRTEPGGIYVDWAPIMKMRQAVADLRIGVNVDEPATAMPLPQWDAPIGFVAPKDIKYITMRVRYKANDEWSEVRRYPIWEGRP